MPLARLVHQPVDDLYREDRLIKQILSSRSLTKHIWMWDDPPTHQIRPSLVTSPIAFMSDHGLWLLHLTSQILAGALAVAAAVLFFLGQLHGETSTEIRAWFRRGWMALNASPWLRLPERILHSAIMVLERASLGFRPDRQQPEYAWRDPTILAALWVILVRISTPLSESPGLQLGSPFATLGIVGWLMLRARRIEAVRRLRVEADFAHHYSDGQIRRMGAETYSVVYTNRSFELTPLQLIETIPSTILLTYAGMLTCLGFLRALTLPVYDALAEIWFLAPGFWLMGYIPLLALTLRRLSRNKPWGPGEFKLASHGHMHAIVAGATLPLSILLTILSLAAGHAFYPEALLPQKAQLFISKLGFDLLTASTTLLLFSAAARRKGSALPMYLLLATVVAAAFAAGSLFFGLAGSADALTIRQVLWVLVGRTPDGSDLELGPLFWAMHTTFIPLLVLVVALLAAWTGKALLLPVHWFFGLGQERTNPHALTAAMLGIFAAVFGGLAQVLDVLRQRP